METDSIPVYSYVGTDSFIVKEVKLKGKFISFPSITFNGCARGICIDSDGKIDMITTSKISKMWMEIVYTQLRIFFKTESSNIYEIDRNTSFPTGISIEKGGIINYHSISVIRD